MNGRLLRVLATCAAIAGAVGLCACSSGQADSRRATPTAVSAVQALERTAAPIATDAAPVARPTSVPAEALPIAGAVDIGDEVGAGLPFEVQDVLYAVHCADDVLVISTTKETLYAELPCATVLPDEVFRPYLARPIAVRVLDTSPRQLQLASAAVGSLGFQVGAAWLLAR